jgi:hypothetical protein
LAPVGNDLQRVQEHDEPHAILAREIVEVANDAGSFAGVAIESVGEGQGQAIVHEASVMPDAPKRRGSQLHGCLRATILHDAVPRSHVMEQKIAEGVNGFVAERVWNGERTAVDHGAGGSSNNGGNVAGIATDAGKDLRAELGIKG